MMGVRSGRAVGGCVECDSPQCACMMTGAGLGLATSVTNPEETVKVPFAIMKETILTSFKKLRLHALPRGVVSLFGSTQKAEAS